MSFRIGKLIARLQTRYACAVADVGMQLPAAAWRPVYLLW